MTPAKYECDSKNLTGTFYKIKNFAGDAINDRSFTNPNPGPLFINGDMMTSSNENIFRVTGHLCGEFTGEFPTQRPVTRNFDVFFDLRLSKRLSKQWWGWWFETLSRPLWRHRNETSYSQISPQRDWVLNDRVALIFNRRLGSIAIKYFVTHIYCGYDVLSNSEYRPWSIHYLLTRPQFIHLKLTASLESSAFHERFICPWHSTKGNYKIRHEMAAP